MKLWLRQGSEGGVMPFESLKEFVERLDQLGGAKEDSWGRLRHRGDVHANTFF